MPLDGKGKLKDMDLFDSSCFKVCKIFLSIIGLWPYQRRLIKIIFGGLTFVLMLSITPAIVLCFYKSFGDIDATMQLVPFVTLYIGTKMQILNCICQQKKNKQILELIKNDWNNVSNETEKEMLHNYGKFGKKAVVFYFAYCWVTVIIINISAATPRIVDIILPMNESRKYFDVFSLEYYVHKEKHPFAFQIHTHLLTFINLAFGVPFDIFFFISIQHACVKFVILGHRIKNISGKKNNLKGENGNIIHKSVSQMITQCIQEHNIIIEFAELIQSSYTIILAFLIIERVVGIFVTGVQTVKSLDHAAEASKYGFLLFGQIIHLCIYSWVGEMLIAHNRFLSNCVYNSSWPEMTVQERRLLNLMLLRSQKPCKITAGKICDLSMESCKRVLKTSLSYFTALNSVR